MERQNHGFNFEKECFNKYSIIPSQGYTDKWDGYLGEIPVSIKTAKLGSDIEMADFFRQASISEDFYLIVGFWSEEKGKNCIIEEHILFINGKEYHSLFSQDYIVKFRELLDTITNDKSDDERWKSKISEYRSEWKKNTPNLIRPRFKRDHKTQKRIQCAINNKDFYSYFISRYAKEMK